mmetsp:Transcript_13222/g.33304  ORF Transcript_13222/g.33304 Transcript_13222/m.33304 type:complete len:320 (-) Transcript_13222:331-1290(-)
MICSSGRTRLPIVSLLSFCIGLMMYGVLTAMIQYPSALVSQTVDARLRVSAEKIESSQELTHDSFANALAVHPTSAFFMTPEEEALEVSMAKSRWEDQGKPHHAKRVVPMSQPMRMGGSRFQIFSSVSEFAKNVSGPALCVHWQHAKGHTEPCGYRNKRIQYTWVRGGRMRSCQDPFDADKSIYRKQTCSSSGINDSQPVLFYGGTTWIHARGGHLPHFCETIAHASNWLAEHPNSSFDNILVDTDSSSPASGSAFNCISFDKYVVGTFVPTSSPLNSTLQYTLLQGLPGGIVNAWNVKPGKIVCFSDPQGYRLNPINA